MTETILPDEPSAGNIRRGSPSKKLLTTSRILSIQISDSDILIRVKHDPQ